MPTGCNPFGNTSPTSASDEPLQATSVLPAVAKRPPLCGSTGAPLPWGHAFGAAGGMRVRCHFPISKPREATEGQRLKNAGPLIPAPHPAPAPCPSTGTGPGGQGVGLA
uniref:Uncharacterized protein n=1 Tax=Eutreptiella gymnastica TaxID=73025 RepID=A0A7S4LDM9_9EUGL